MNWAMRTLLIVLAAIGLSACAGGPNTLGGGGGGEVIADLEPLPVDER